MTPDIKRVIIQAIQNETATVFTDPLTSPTGFPFKVVRLEDTLSEPDSYEQRHRVCDMGYLRTAYKTADCSIGFRCPGEPLDVYLLKGGRLKTP